MDNRGIHLPIRDTTTAFLLVDEIQLRPLSSTRFGRCRQYCCDLLLSAVSTEQRHWCWCVPKLVGEYRVPKDRRLAGGAINQVSTRTDLRP